MELRKNLISTHGEQNTEEAKIAAKSPSQTDSNTTPQTGGTAKSFQTGPANTHKDLRYHWHIHGHERKLQALETDIINKNLSHAYLFAGPEHIGKFSIAKNFAQILQCPQNFCRTCNVCLHIEKGWHMDTIEIQDNGESIKIETIRDLLEKLYLSTQSRYKILLLQNIERMTPEATNALLKTLEEPPGKVIFLLTTSNVKEVLPTIISRVRLVQFSAFSENQLQTIIKKFYPLFPPEDLATLCLLAGGKSGKALSFIEQPEFFKKYQDIYTRIRSFLNGSTKAEIFSYINEIAKDGSQIEDFLEVLLAILRYDILAEVKSGKPKNHQKYIELVKKAMETRQMLKRNVNTRLALENLMLYV